MSLTKLLSASDLHFYDCKGLRGRSTLSLIRLKRPIRP
jgi:hypothetical protein